MIPPSFKPATVRGVLPLDRVTDELGVSFDLSDGSVVRLRIPMVELRALYANIYDKRGVHAFHHDSMPRTDWPVLRDSATPSEEASDAA